jgi:hypothetical protein
MTRGISEPPALAHILSSIVSSPYVKGVLPYGPASRPVGEKFRDFRNMEPTDAVNW